MIPQGPSTSTMTAGFFWRWGSLCLVAGLMTSVLAVVYLTWRAPHLLVLIPLAIVAAVSIVHLFRYPLLNLAVVLAGFVLIVNYSDGITGAEVLYGVYCLFFLGHWFLTRLFLYRDEILAHPEDKALLIFLIAATLTFPLTVLFGGHISWMLSEWVALAMLAFYFPVKEAFTKHRNGPLWIFIALGWIGLYVSVRNILFYQQAMANAEYAWQIARGRSYMNDTLLMVMSLGLLAFMTFARTRLSLLLRLSLFLVFLTSLILTQSRGLWAAFLLGAGVLFMLVDRTHKRRLMLLTVAGGACFIGIGVLFFGDHVNLVFAGLLNRFSSLQTAASQDVSLINRFRETAAAWELIKLNPVLGYGMGVPYVFFDLAHMGTDKDAFIHNGYISLWYKFGLWGLLLIIFVWGRLAWQGLHAFHRDNHNTWSKLGGLAAGISLVAIALSTLTSNPFFLKDSTFLFGVLLGLAGGAFHRMSRDPDLPYA